MYRFWSPVGVTRMIVGEIIWISRMTFITMIYKTIGVVYCYNRLSKHMMISRNPYCAKISFFNRNSCSKININWADH